MGLCTHDYARWLSILCIVATSQSGIRWLKPTGPGVRKGRWTMWGAISTDGALQGHSAAQSAHCFLYPNTETNDEKELGRRATLVTAPCLWQACTWAVSASAVTFSIDRCHCFHFSLPNLVQVSPVANSNPGPREEGVLGNRVLALLCQHTRNHNRLSLIHLAILWKYEMSLHFSKPALTCK